MELLKKDDNEIVSKVVKDFKNAEDNREPYDAKWTNNYRLYRSKIKEKREGKANLFIPYIFPIIEQLKARAKQALFQKLPYVGFAGVEQGDIDGAKIMESLVGFQMDTKINLPHKSLLALQSIFCYGTVISLYEWKYQEKQIKKKEPIIAPILNIKIGEKDVKENIVSYDDPNIEIIPVDDFYPDPEGWDMQTCSYVCTRAWRDETYLRDKEKEGVYTLPDKIEEDSSGEVINNFRDSVTGLPTIQQTDRNKNHEIISYYTDNEKIVILNRKYVIQKEENPLYSKEKPFKRGVAIEAEKEFWGISIIEVLADLQEELNTTRNQRIDNVSLILNKVMLKRRNADVDNFEIKAGNVIEVDDLNTDLKPLEFGDVTRAAYEEEQIIKQDMQYISGVSEYSRGATPQRKETATTVTTIQEAANILFNYTIGVIERTWLLPLGDAIKKLDQQYLDKERVIRILGEAGYNYEPVSPESIAGSYDVVSVSPMLEAQANKEVKRAQLLEMLNTFTKNPATAQFVNVPEMMKMIMSNYDIKDYTKLLIDPQTIQPNTGQIPPVNPMVPNQNMPMMNETLQEIGENNGL